VYDADKGDKAAAAAADGVLLSSILAPSPSLPLKDSVHKISAGLSYLTV